MGPRSTSVSRPLPNLQAFGMFYQAGSEILCHHFCHINPLTLMQICPMFEKARWEQAAAALSRSASSQTMNGDWPPKLKRDPFN